MIVDSAPVGADSNRFIPGRATGELVARTSPHFFAVPLKLNNPTSPINVIYV